MSLRQLLLSFRGRVSRSKFWWAAVVLSIVFYCLYVPLETTFGHNRSLALYPPFFWATAAITVKRLHDRGKSPVWLVLLLIPLIGPLFVLIDVAVRRGTAGENRYGPDPLADDRDYLTVT